MDEQRILTERDLEAEDLGDWRMLIDRLHASFDIGDFAGAVALVGAIGEAVEEFDHGPDLEITDGRLDVRLLSREAGGVTAHDVTLARRISALAAAAGAVARPERTAVLELALDTADEARVRPFWAALLDLDVVKAWGELQLRDATGRRPSIWFQPTAPEDGAPRQRWHLDLRLPPELVEPRIAAALAAGGTLVDDAAAPAYWVLADPDGNRACVTTWQGRD